MDHVNDDEVIEYIDSHLPKELGDEVRASLMVFDAYGYSKPYITLQDAVTAPEAEDTDLLQSTFFQIVQEGLDAILAVHRVVLMDEVDLATKNQILGALYRLQYLEDPVPVLKILEGEDDDEGKLARIVEIYSDIDHGTLMTAIESVDPTTLTVLQDFLYQGEKENEEAETPESLMQKSLLMANMKDFILLNGKDCLAAEMITNGIQPGHLLSLYYPFVKDLLVTENIEQTAVNLLSFFFLGRDTYAEPLKAFRVMSETLIENTTDMVKIEVKLTELIEALRNHQKVTHEARSLSVIQYPA
jgi:hypothetical protein